MKFSGFDVVVIGNGLIGSAAAKYLSHTGKQVAVIGTCQRDDNAKQVVYASHYDQARIQRLIGKDTVWTNLNKTAVDGYSELQECSGINFHSPVGCLYVNPYGRDGYLLNADKIAAGHQLTYTCFNNKERLDAAFADYKFPEGSQGLLEKAPAGSINPRLLLKAQNEVLRQNSGMIFTDTIEAVIAETDGFTIQSYDRNIYYTNQVLIAAGSFINFIRLPSRKLKLSVKGEVILLAKLEEADALKFAALPSLLYEINNEKTEGIYLVRPVQYPDGGWYIKMGCNLPGDLYFTTLKEAQDWFEYGDSDQFLPDLIEALRTIMPDIRPVEYLTKRCVISRSAHGRPYIGESNQQGLYFACGCNGYSAMCSDAIGKIAASVMVSGKAPAGFSLDDLRLVYE